LRVVTVVGQALQIRHHHRLVMLVLQFDALAQRADEVT
jgi:hypothetical protein